MIPVGFKVVIEPDEPEQMSKGGIFLPDMITNKDSGTVIAVGEKATVVKPGDRVLYDIYKTTGLGKGYSLLIGGKKYLLAREEDIHVVLDVGEK